MALLSMALPAWAAGAASGEDLARCAGITAPEARLACYDSLAQRLGIRAPVAVTAPTEPAAPGAGSPHSPALARANAPASAPANAPTSAATPASPSASASWEADPQNFGLTSKQLRGAPQGPKAIQARIATVSADRIGHAYVVLDNGQTWTMTDADGRLAAGDPISINRAALGSYLMVTASNHSYRVRRIQ
jgi:hypothetical protein